MNWIGISGRALLAAMVGCAIGFWAFGALRVAVGLEAPWLVALLGGAAVALASRGKSVMRGLFVGTIVVWVAAAAQAHYAPRAAAEPIWTGLVHFHETLDASGWAAFAATAVLAVLLAAWCPFAELPSPTRRSAR